MTIYNDTISETANVADPTAVMATGVLGDLIKMSVPVCYSQKGYFRTITDTITITPTNAQVWQHTALIQEILKIVRTVTPSAIYNIGVAEGVRFKDAFANLVPVALAEAITIGSTLVVQQGVQLFEKLGIADALIPQGKYQITVSEFLSIADLVQRFIGGSLAEAIAITETLVIKRMTSQTVSEAVTIVDTETVTLFTYVTAQELLQLTDQQLMLYTLHELVAENIKFNSVYVEPNGGFTAFATNMRTGFVTEYLNYAFNSFAAMGNKYLGAADSGLYELDGDTDNGSLIVADVQSGWIDLGGSHFSSFKAAYIGMRGGGTIYLKLVSGTGAYTLYEVTTKSLQTTKVHLGKGLRSKLYSFEFTTVGQDFNLDNIEFVPIVNQRRV